MLTPATITQIITRQGNKGLHVAAAVITADIAEGMKVSETPGVVLKCDTWRSWVSLLYLYNGCN